MNADAQILLAAPPPTTYPLAGPRERRVARILFYGACASILPTAAMTVVSLAFFLLVLPVLIAALFNWFGWWLLVNYRLRGWDRPMGVRPYNVWITSMVFNTVGFVGVGWWGSHFLGRPGEEPMVAFLVLYLGWLFLAVVASAVAVIELVRTRERGTRAHRLDGPGADLA